MLALSFVLQPVLAAIGETHELSHAAAMQADGHVVDQHDHDEQVSGSEDPGYPGAPTDPGEGDSSWHAALHFAHCCGQVPSTLTSAHLTVSMQFGAAAVPQAYSTLRVASSAFEPQRPPIL
ncbi:hypothetical protein [Thermomonas sp. HDW16]|uniref:hypothetical protein n=1 Tax=Thermomonas sp. HDW16 TaxID=2714945 RepID=UPI001409746A|nr:hypothetical protein [Thermomonas sp. HDW16]QIL20196.1 hypothetical protein G7079_05265 [Thermomonas sp. HDW16]